MNRPISPAPEVEAYKLMQAGRPAEALQFAEQATVGKRVCLPAHGMLATILFQIGRRQEASSVIARALELEQGIADAYDALAHVAALLGDHELSNSLYQRVVKLAPVDPRFWYNLASSQRSLGRLKEAEEACDRAIALDRTQYASYLLRSELRVQSAESNHVAQLQAELIRPDVTDRARVLLGYALAKELDDLRRYDEAFQSLKAASDLRRRQLAYDVTGDVKKLARIQEVFPASPKPESGDDGDSGRYIFIVGLPRSGTTLLEHMLIGLQGVRSNGETDNFARALLAVAPRGHADVFAGAAAADPKLVAGGYARLADSGSAGEKVIDKLPMNYLYLGAIRRALPGAKLILVSREPVDSCFAMYRVLFGEAYPFTYDFDDLAKYYAAYDGLVGHWRRCFGDTLHEITYEDLVRDPEGTGAKVADYLGVTWDPSATQVHKRASVSLTASAAQIRKPIYATSSGRWRHYHSHLGPLAAALRRHQVAVPADLT